MSPGLARIALLVCGSLGCVISTGGEPLPGYGGTSGGGGGGNGGGGPVPVETGPPIPTGAAWIPSAANLTGLVSECGNIHMVFARPDRDMLITGVAQHGLWASSDGSPMWTKLGTGPGSAVITNRMTWMVFDPVNRDTFWEAGIYNGGGVYKTTDNGVTFEQLGDAKHNDMVAVDLSDPERKTLLAGSHEVGALLLRSTDGGKTWTNIGERLPEGAGASGMPYIVDTNTYLLGTYNSQTAGLFRTTDAGMTWTQVVMGAMYSGPTLGADGSIYWAKDRSGGVRSPDKGATWIDLGNMPQMGITVVELPDGRLVSTWDKKLVISASRGASWRRFGPELPWEATGLLYSKFRKALYAWHFGCGPSGAEVPVDADQIVRLDFDYQAR